MNHRELLEKISKAMQPDVYVELGVYLGKCFNMVSAHASEAWAVDIEDVGETIRRGANFYKGTTKDFSEHWNDNIKKHIDLIFIDADHSKEAVLNDVVNFLPWLKVDTGLMVLHDTWPKNKMETSPKYSGNAYLVPPIVKNLFGVNTEILTFPYLCGLTFIRALGDNWRNGY